MDEVVRRVMSAAGDPRAVIADPHARYFGAELEIDSLTPDEGAIIGVTRFDAWLKQHASTLRVEGISYPGFPPRGVKKPDFLTRVPRARGTRKMLSPNR